MHQTLKLKPKACQLKLIGIYLFLLLMVGACGAGRYISKGDKRFEQEQYQSAIEYYQRALGKADNSGELNYKVAEAYRLSNRLSQAEEYYNAALDANYRKEDIYYYYGMALKANGKYEQAQGQLRDYVRVGTNSRLKALAQRELENYNALNSILRKAPAFEVRNLDTLNTDASEFAPAVADNELYFSSTRGGQEYSGNGEGFLDIYVTSMGDSAIGGNVRKVEGINSDDLHEAYPTFTNEGRTMVFARGNEGTKKGRQNVDLFVSYFRSNAWTEPKILGISDPQAWDSSPAFSPDGKTLYFSSNRRGTLGGNDIYRTTIDGNGRFSTPENLGPEINTQGNESFVYVAPDGTLYIASDGLPGLGNLDLFRIEDGKPVNLGAPLNSPGDDFGIFYKDEATGYFSSNRDGGSGGDDIYSFTESVPKQVNFVVDGTLLQLRDGARQQTVVPNHTVVLQNEAGERLQETQTDTKGKFTFELEPESTYSLISQKPNFFTARQQITTAGKTPPEDQLQEGENEVRLTATLVLNEIVRDKPIVLENIYYDLDKANIRPDAAAELDKLVQILKDNPGISIELSSHTDVRGSDEYNQDLSQRRAEAAVEYIISQGIDRDRITARGYGESQLIVKNAQTEEEHQRNRRTEFRVIRVQE
ncbi:OmpA family protein [Pontibacter silvestris]|uniref:OmpA family protein n=1 Tax=Pontibacter silvestris TaxID=2305183 RepID=A0ABW4WXZ5_9BACT|nr:OmpA family protein [Pontibacter silvestris]